MADNTNNPQRIIQTEKIYENTHSNIDSQRKYYSQIKYQSHNPLKANNQSNTDTYTNPQRISYKEKNDKLNKLLIYQTYEGLLKKIVIVFLSIFHCYQLFFFGTNKSFITALFLIESSSFFIMKYIRNQIQAITPQKSNASQQNQTQTNNIIQMADSLMQQCSFVEIAFYLFNLITDLFQDLSIVLLINVSFLLLNEYLTHMI